MKPARNPTLVQPGAVDIAAQWRAEAKTRDWGAVHVACDRSEPVLLTMLRRIHRL